MRCRSVSSITARRADRRKLGLKASYLESAIGGDMLDRIKNPDTRSDPSPWSANISSTTTLINRYTRRSTRGHRPSCPGARPAGEAEELEREGPRSCWPASMACSFRAASASAASMARLRPSAIARQRGIPFFGVCLGLQCAVDRVRPQCRSASRRPLYRVRPKRPHPVVCLLQRAKKSPTGPRCGSALTLSLVGR